MEASYFVIAGPQAAGKTTTIEYLSKIYRNSNSFNDCRRFSFFKEGREIINKKYSIGGAIAMTKQDEIKAIELDMKKMFETEEEMKSRADKIYVDECNIFNLAHASMHGILIENYLEEYCSILKRLNAKIIFLDVVPEISWQRRKNKYFERAKSLPLKEQEEIMREYKRYLKEVYPNLLRLYKRLNFPKFKLDASFSLEKCLSSRGDIFKELLRN